MDVFCSRPFHSTNGFDSFEFVCITELNRLLTRLLFRFFSLFKILWKEKTVCIFFSIYVSNTSSNYGRVFFLIKTSHRYRLHDPRPSGAIYAKKSYWLEWTVRRFNDNPSLYNSINLSLISKKRIESDILWFAKYGKNHGISLHRNTIWANACNRCVCASGT